VDSKHFNILAISAFISFVTAGLVHSAYNTWTPEKIAGEKLLPDFEGYANNIANVVLQSGETTLTLTRAKDGTWGLAERGSYPVVRNKVRSFLGQVAKAELVEAKTRDPKRYNLLELDDPAGKDASSKLIKLSDAKGNVFSELVIGKQRYSAFGSGKSGSYARRAGNNQTWLTNVAIQVPLKVADWVEPAFFKMSMDKVSSMTLTPPDGPEVRVVLETPEKKADSAENKDTGDKTKTAGAEPKSKPAEIKFKFAAIPEGQKLKDDVDATQIVRALETLELTDVRKAGSVAAPKDAETLKALVETKDAMQLDMAVVKTGESERWLTIAVRADGKDAEAAKQMKARVEGWEFKIPNWRSGQIFKTSVELFDAAQEEQEEDGQEDKENQRDENGDKKEADDQ